MEHRPYTYTSEEEFLEDLGKLEKGLPYTKDISILNTSLVIGGKVIKNRLLAQPIEGGDSSESGVPSERAKERYAELAAGGSGTIWMESISVNREGKSMPKQMWLNEDTEDGFAALVKEIHAKGHPFVVAQLTHSGRNSNPDGKRLAVCAYENPKLPKDNMRIITDEELDALREDYIQAAVLAERAGFDAVDIRACHGYLLNELFSAFERTGRYGGTYENRTRLVRDIVKGVHEKTNLIIGVRLNIMDGLPYPYGWGCDREGSGKQDINEPLRLVKELEELGVSIINISAGIGACTPYMIRPYDKGNVPNEHPLESVERLLQSAKAVKEAVPSVCVVASGFTWLRKYAANVAAGGIEAGWFDLAGFGRQWVANSNYANEILEKGIPNKLCTTCGACMALLKNGKEMRCVHK